MRIFRCGTCHKHFLETVGIKFKHVNKYTKAWCPECKTTRRIYFIKEDK